MHEVAYLRRCIQEMLLLKWSVNVVSMFCPELCLEGLDFQSNTDEAECCLEEILVWTKAFWTFWHTILKCLQRLIFKSTT